MWGIKQKNKFKRILFVITALFLVSNFLTGFVKGTEVLTSSSNFGEWRVWRWYEFYNITQDGKMDGWIVLNFDFLEENATNDFQLEIELPAYNKSIEYYSPNSSVVSFSRRDSAEGVDVKILFNKSISKNYRSFDIAIHYVVRENLILTKKSEWFESFVRYEFETRISIWDPLLPESKEEDSPIVNIYISMPGSSSITTPEKFLKISKTQFKKIYNLIGSNRANEPICETSLPAIKPSENAYLTIRYIGGSSPGIVIFEYSFTNTWIVALTVLAVILGLISSAWAVYTITKIFYHLAKNKIKQNKRYMKKENGIRGDEEMNFRGEDQSKAFRWIIVGISAYVFLFVYILLRNPTREFEIDIAMLTAIPTIILIGATVMYVESSHRLVKETQLQRKRTFIEEIIKKILLPLLDRLKGQIDWFESNNAFHVKNQKCYLSNLNIKNLIFAKHQDVFYKIFSSLYEDLSKKIERHISKIPELKKICSEIINKIHTNEFRKIWETNYNNYQKNMKGKDLFSNRGDFSWALDNILESIIKGRKSNNIPDKFWNNYGKELLLLREKNKKDFESLDKKTDEIRESLENIKNDVINTINSEQEKYGILALE